MSKTLPNYDFHFRNINHSDFQEAMDFFLNKSNHLSSEYFFGVVRQIGTESAYSVYSTKERTDIKQGFEVKQNLTVSELPLYARSYAREFNHPRKGVPASTVFILPDVIDGVTKYTLMVTEGKIPK